ncbi:MAG: hypothetical protein IKM39_01555 [Clostridia bacterium]|nr:hypothetical protein [Clostridia bacterium]
MINLIRKRLLPLLLVMLMLVSVVPSQVFAAENSVQTEAQEEHQHMDYNPFTETVLLKQVKSEMDTVLTKYLGTTVMDQNTVLNTAIMMDGET